MIRINKEEAIILAESLKAHKYTIAEMGRQKQDAHAIMGIMTQLQEKLEQTTVDERMIGRTSLTDTYNRIKRYLLRKNSNINF